MTFAKCWVWPDQTFKWLFTICFNTLNRFCGSKFFMLRQLFVKDRNFQAWKFDFLLLLNDDVNFSSTPLIENLLRCKRSHITPGLKDIHCLPVKRRMQFKVLTLVYTGSHVFAPDYISNLLVNYQPSPDQFNHLACPHVQAIWLQECAPPRTAILRTGGMLCSFKLKTLIPFLLLRFSIDFFRLEFDCYRTFSFDSFGTLCVAMDFIIRIFYVHFNYSFVVAMWSTEIIFMDTALCKKFVYYMLCFRWFSVRFLKKNNKKTYKKH